jgi:hypothetical protein
MDVRTLDEVRLNLKSGEYDGVDVMRAWLAIDELQLLHQQLAVKDLEVMQLRDRLTFFCNSGLVSHHFPAYVAETEGLLSTTFTPDNLMAWYKEQLGKPFSYYKSDEASKRNEWPTKDWIFTVTTCKDEVYDTPLYAPKIDVKG